MCQLDEGRTSSLHGADEKAIPPDGTPSISVKFFPPFSDEKHRATNNNRYEECKEVNESFSDEQRFPDPFTEEKEQSGREGTIEL